MAKETQNLTANQKALLQSEQKMIVARASYNRADKMYSSLRDVKLHNKTADLVDISKAVDNAYRALKVAEGLCDKALSKTRADIMYQSEGVQSKLNSALQLARKDHDDLKIDLQIKHDEFRVQNKNSFDNERSIIMESYAQSLALSKSKVDEMCAALEYAKDVLRYPFSSKEDKVMALRHKQEVSERLVFEQNESDDAEWSARSSMYHSLMCLEHKYDSIVVEESAKQSYQLKLSEQIIHNISCQLQKFEEDQSRIIAVAMESGDIIEKKSAVICASEKLKDALLAQIGIKSSIEDDEVLVLKKNTIMAYECFAKEEKFYLQTRSQLEGSEEDSRVEISYGRAKPYYFDADVETKIAEDDHMHILKRIYAQNFVEVGEIVDDIAKEVVDKIVEEMVQNLVDEDGGECSSIDSLLMLVSTQESTQSEFPLFAESKESMKRELLSPERHTNRAKKSKGDIAVEEDKENTVATFSMYDIDQGHQKLVGAAISPKAQPKMSNIFNAPFNSGKVLGLPDLDCYTKSSVPGAKVSTSSFGAFDELVRHSRLELEMLGETEHDQ